MAAGIGRTFAVLCKGVSVVRVVVGREGKGREEKRREEKRGEGALTFSLLLQELFASA